MRVLFVSSEATPYSKTGGLADVCGALPKALAALGNQTALVTPFYKCAREYFERTGAPLERIYGATIEAPIGGRAKQAGVLRTKLEGVDVYFIEHNDYFDRDGLYNNQGVDHADNCERFSFFSRAALELINVLDLDFDIVHANDWQTALVSVYLDAVYKSRSRFSGDGPFLGSVRPHLGGGRNSEKFDKMKSILTIHNLRHQGRFWRGAMDLTGLDWSLFTYDKMEFYGQLNLLKSGVVFSDAITTVSPQYAREIQTEGFGEKLQGVLQMRSADLYGVLNGIDVDEWNPATDKAIPANYDVDSFEVGKAKCKEELQRQLGLSVDPNAPLLGVVSRFDVQKGLDLVSACAPEFIERAGVQFAILGSGDMEIAERFGELAWRYPRNFAVQNRFSVELSHQIEAGADLFLMPSRYEPCGLNQMYSLRYGTLPLVRDVGGLHDSVVNGSDENIANGTADGFLFYWESVDDIRKAIDWALYLYRCRRDDWKRMIRAAMTKDLSWNESARKYQEIYEKVLAGAR
ncbi:MAG: glycogen synthase [Thermoguttaceae bacterium]|nr:glycogen synthase [Thermoguttaceae bacterium]